MISLQSPDVHYAKSGDVHIAYQTFGGGNLNLVLVPGWTSHLDIWWDNHYTVNWLNRISEYARILLFDKRGTGLSDRSEMPPGMDQRMDDIRAVMDAAGVESAAILGWSEGGTLATLFAASHPDRCQALVLHGAFARFQSWLEDEAALDRFFQYVETKWGTGESYANYCPSTRGDEHYREWWARRERSSASPGAAIRLMKLNSAINISGILPSVKVPTLIVHRSEDQVADFEGGVELSKLIPNAELFEVSGKDHVPWIGDGLETIATRVQEFLTGTRPRPAVDRILTTVLFTDIASSTARAERLGDRKWKQLLDMHNGLVRQELNNFRGTEIKTTGDGFLAMFDGPARAVHAALAIIQGIEQIGLEIRAGVHIGEVQLHGGDITGITVNVAARTMEAAAAGDCLVTRMVKDLVAGSELSFQGCGPKTLKGISEPVELFSAS